MDNQCMHNDGHAPYRLPRKTTIPIRKFVVAKVRSPYSISVRRRIDTVSPSRWTDMRAVDRRTERNHVLMDHATEEGIAACDPC